MTKKLIIIECCLLIALIASFALYKELSKPLTIDDIESEELKRKANSK